MFCKDRQSRREEKWHNTTMLPSHKAGQNTGCVMTYWKTKEYEKWTNNTPLFLMLVISVQNTDDEMRIFSSTERRNHAVNKWTRSFTHSVICKGQRTEKRTKKNTNIRQKENCNSINNNQLWLLERKNKQTTTSISKKADINNANTANPSKPSYRLDRRRTYYCFKIMLRSTKIGETNEWERTTQNFKEI